MKDEIPLDDEQLKVVGLIGVVVLAMAAAPMMLAPSDEPELEANNGTVTTPEQTSIEQTQSVDRESLGNLNAIPASHLRDDSGPEVSASAGTQTMSVETTTVNGEPALNLTDERTHEGRWVSVPIEWFQETHGEVPEVARIAHETNGTYTESIRVRGESAVFWVRGFSTNTVIFGADLVIQDQPAINGTRHSYEIGSMETVDDVSINVTGVTNSETRTVSTTSTGEFDTSIGGNVDPQETTITVEGNGFGSNTVSGSATSVSDGYSETVELDGSLTDTSESATPTVDVTGAMNTEAKTETVDSLSSGESWGISIGGNQDPSGPGGSPELTVTNPSDRLGQQENYLGGDSIRMGEQESQGLSYSVDSPSGGNVGNELVLKTGNGYSGIEFNISVGGEQILTKEPLSTGESYTFDYAKKTASDGSLTVDIEMVTNDEYDFMVFDEISVNSNTSDVSDLTVSSDTGTDTTFSSIPVGESRSASFPISRDVGTLSSDYSGPGGLDYEMSYTERTQTADPVVDVNGETVSHTGSIADGETETLTVPDGALNTGGGSNTVTLNLPSASGGPQMNADISYSFEELDGSLKPSVDTDGDGAAEVSSDGVLTDGETTTTTISPSVGDKWEISATGNAPTVSAEITERTQTRNPAVIVNGELAGYAGTLSDGETISLNASSSWLQEGTNNVTIRVGDDSFSGGPEPQVNVDYRHDIDSHRTVEYESEALSESYNISKTYPTSVENATLKIPHARTVLSMRSLEYRLNETGTWSSVPESAAELSRTTLTVSVSDLVGEPVPEGTTIEVRSTGSRVDPQNAEISVIRVTPVGFDLNSRVRLDTWSPNSSLGVGETPQGGLIHYARNESYSAESDYVELTADGNQRFHAPNASSGSELTLNTLPARVSPEKNTMRVRVPDDENASDSKFVVEPGSVVGDAWTAEYVAGTDGNWYALVDADGEQLDAAQKPEPLEASRDDVGVVAIKPTDPQGGPSDSVGGGIFATATAGNLPSLVVLFGSVAMLFVAGRRPASSRDAVDGFAAGVDGAISRIPRVGGPLGSAAESGVSAIGSGLVSVGENRLLTGAIGAAVVVSAAEVGLITIGSEAGAILVVAGIAVGSLFLLREADAFTTARWIAIVGVSGVVALQGLGEGDLLTELVNSDAFLIVVLIAGYAAIQLLREYRANNSPDDDRPQVIVGGRLRSGGDDEGSNR